jgi:HAD superfamily hydrolase (TIGR01549 family)
MKSTSEVRPDASRTPGFIFFDLDDTLLDHRAAQRAALADLYRQFRPAFGDHDFEVVHDAYRVANRDLWRAYAHGEIVKSQLKRKRFEHLSRSCTDGSLAWNELSAYYLERYSAHWTPIASALDCFAAVANHFPVGIITNGFSEIQREKLGRFPAIADRLDAAIISEDAGYLKPDRRLFEIAARRAAISPASILYAGDSYESDVRGAVDAGWMAAWYRPEGAIRRDGVFVFERWSDFARHLGLTGSGARLDPAAP